MSKNLTIFTGFAGLFIGALIYLTDRSPESTYFVSRHLYSVGEALHNTLPDCFGIFDKNMPSFLHTFSFTLITGAFIGESKKSSILSATLWSVINLLFELGQYFDKLATQLIPDWFNRFTFLEALDGYFIAGTFDILDVVAIFLGALVGYLI
ncbi:MAG: hypothetical protein HQK74_11445, partial [Desulfamplus sp.]|nr:hypothetical protein [Desulfamplus sp.]